MIRIYIPDIPPCKCGGEARWYYESGSAALRGERGSGFIMCTQCGRSTRYIASIRLSLDEWGAGHRSITPTAWTSSPR